MSNCRVYDDNIDCHPLPPEPPKPKVCSPFSVCLPFGRRLVYDGTCLSLDGGPNIPDGTYGMIVVQNGCIVGAKANPVFEYTPPPCSPAADPCGGDGSGATLAPGACNLLSLDGSGRLSALLYTQAGPGIDLSGCGSASSPLVISVSGGGGGGGAVYLTSGTPDVLPLAGSGNIADPWIISHAEISMGPGTYGGLTIDSYGHIVGYAETGGAVSTIVAGPGIDVQIAGGVATISLQASPIGAGTWLLGGYNVTTDMSGRVVGVSRAITIPAGEFDPCTKLITVNAYGSITGIRDDPNAGGGGTGGDGGGGGGVWAKLYTTNAVDQRTMTITTSQTARIKVEYWGPFRPAGGLQPQIPRIYVNDSPLETLWLRGESGDPPRPWYDNIASMSVISYPPGTHTIDVVSTGGDFLRDGWMEATLFQSGV